MTTDVPVNTAKRTFELLETIEDLNGANFSKVMDAMDMPRSTTHDYLQTLLKLDYIVLKDGKYHISMKCLRLGEKHRRMMKIYQATHSEIKSLAEKTGEHATFNILDHGWSTILDHASAEKAVQLELFPGQRYPPTLSASGKAILAHSSDKYVGEILDKHGLPSATEASITSRDNLFEEFEEIRDRGYALCLEEYNEGLRAISVPVRCNDEVHGSVTVSGPVQRLSDKRLTENLPPLIFETGNIIEVNYMHS